jgi:hypothetical protein
MALETPAKLIGPVEAHKPNLAKEYFVDRAIGEAAST